MSGDWKDILELLSLTEYHTASELANKLGVSSKTVRTRIKELDLKASKHGVRIDSKSRYGYILVEKEEGGIQRLAEDLTPEIKMPDNNEERINYLLVYLLNHNEFTKMDDLCDFLCVSRTTLQTAMKNAEEILKEYNLELERRPNYGIRIKGNEFNIRRCIGECFVKRDMLNHSMQIYSSEELERLAQEILDLTRKYKISLSEKSFENLITQIYVAAKRIKRGCAVSFGEGKEAEEKKYQTEYRFSRELALYMSEWQHVIYTKQEITYIVIYLAGIRVSGSTENENFVIREELDDLVRQMLELIYSEYRLEFRNNFNLRMSLNQHMVPFDIRMRYHIHMENPILDEIHEKYVLGYTLAETACNVLQKYYGREVTKDEVGYFAILFALALEQENIEVEKASILIICSVGRGSSQLIRYKYEKEFGKYLDTIYVCGLHELEHFDFNTVDYVFSTVPIHMEIPVPITNIGQFLERRDILKVRQVLERGQMDFLDDYYKEQQFLTDVEGETKEETIRSICDKIAEQRQLPEGFYEAVIQREKLGGTDFGNNIAMPHPYKVITKDTFIYVAVLKNKIIWNKFPVQLVFLAAISAQEDKNLPKFYEVTTSLFQMEEMVEKIIKEQKFEVLMQALRQIFYEE